jgi:hypothetical protein
MVEIVGDVERLLVRAQRHAIRLVELRGRRWPIGEALRPGARRRRPCRMDRSI